MTKRFLAIMVLVLLFFNITKIAYPNGDPATSTLPGKSYKSPELPEQIEINCYVQEHQLKSLRKSDRKRFSGKTIKLLINTEKKTITNLKPQYDLFLLHGVETSIAIKEGGRPYIQNLPSVFKFKSIIKRGTKFFNYESDVVVKKEVWWGDSVEKIEMSYSVEIVLIPVADRYSDLELKVYIRSTGRDNFNFKFGCASNTVSGEELIQPEVYESSTYKKD